MRGADVRHYIDKAGAQQALAAGYSRKVTRRQLQQGSTSSHQAAVPHLLELVDSKANVIDALSHDTNGAWKGWAWKVEIPILGQLARPASAEAA